jgi:hypothetical protein
LIVEVLRTRRIRRDERQVDFRLRGGKFDLGFFRGFFQALQRELVLAQVDALFFFEFVGEIIDDARMSKSSPPRNVSPLVDFTSKTPSPISRTEISNVPPPRS